MSSVCQNLQVRHQLGSIGMSRSDQVILPMCTFNLRSYISECTSLNPIWDNMVTETSFPILFGIAVEITCDTGYKLEGSNRVTCDRGTTYTFVEQPACKELGKLFRHCVY